MNSLPTNLRISRRGFTLVELMMAMSLVGGVGLMMFNVLMSTMKLSAQNVVTNVSNYRARQTLDRLGQLVRFAQDTPVLINTDGSLAAGTTADGLLVKNALGGPYVFKNISGNTADDIPSGANSFIVEYAPATGVDIPKVGDFFLLSLSTRPELEVATVNVTSSVGSISRVQITTRLGIPETARPSSYTVAASRYRKEAYVFVQSGSQWNLRHYPKVVAGLSYASSASYRTLGTGFQKLGTQAWFTTMIDNGTQACWLRAVARSSNHAEYSESASNHNTLTTMPVQVKLWNYNAPPPAAP